MPLTIPQWVDYSPYNPFFKLPSKNRDSPEVEKLLRHLNIMEKKMETARGERDYIGIKLGLHRDNGKENGNY